MICGIGTDLIEIERIARLLQNPRFLERVYTKEEQRQLRSAESYAANFAAKEAYSKALGTGVSGFSLTDIEILRDERGKPYLLAYRGAACAGRVHVSLSHSREYAQAFVVVEE